MSEQRPTPNTPPDVRIQAPCPEDWARMSGDALTRYCDRCELEVHDLSQLTDEEIYALRRERGERLCVRIRRDASGRMITRTRARERTLSALRRLAAQLAEREGRG